MSIRKGNLVLAAKGVIKAEAKSYVVDNTVATEFDSMADTITLTSDFVDYNGNTVTLGQLVVGDNVIVKQINVPDRYVLSKTTTSVTFGTLETSKIVIPTTVDGMTGGTITAASGDTAVRFKSKSTGSFVGFVDTNNNVLGYYGVTGSRKPVFYDSSEHQLALLSDIPTTYVSTVNGSSGAITDVAKTNTTNTFTQNQQFDGLVYLEGSTPFVMSKTGKIGLRATNDQNQNLGQINISNAWYGNDNRYGLQLSAFDGTDNKYNQIRISHNGPEYIVYDNSTSTETSKTIATTDQIPTVNDASLTLQFNGNTLQTFTANASSNVTANIKALPNYSLTINHNTAGNPRHVKFLSINYSTYTSNASAYIKLGAMSCHGNGTSYQFLDDIIIGCYYPGDIASPPAEPTVVCQNYKFIQVSCGTVDGADRNYGDIYYTIDTTNKIVDFYILCGQYASSQFTPFTKIGSTITTGITQYSGTATYYSSGTKNWAGGNSTTYARKEDIPSVSGLESASNKVTSISSSSTDTQYPSAKCVYDIIGDVETLLTALNSGSGV